MELEAVESEDALVTALVEACGEGDTPAVEALLRSRPHLVHACDGRGRTPLLAGATHAPLVALLLGRGADATVPGRGGWLVRQAARRGPETRFHLFSFFSCDR